MLPRSRSLAVTDALITGFPLWIHDTPGSTGLHIGRTTESGRAAGPFTVGVDRSRCEPKETVMNPIRHLRRMAGVLAGLASAWLGLAMAAPAAFAVTHPTPGPAAYLTPGAPAYPVPQ